MEYGMRLPIVGGPKKNRVPVLPGVGVPALENMTKQPVQGSQSPTHASTHYHHKSKQPTDGQSLSHSQQFPSSQQPVQQSHHTSLQKPIKEQIDSGKHKNGVIYPEGKLVATVAPTTLPHLNQSESQHQSRRHKDDASILPSLMTAESTRQNTLHSSTCTPDRSKRDPYGNKLPLTPAEALKLYRDKLTVFEQTEILDYPEIWFLGLEAKKIEGEPGSAQNNGYDDENGSYIKVQNDHMVYRYEIFEVLGKGSFGQVVKAYDYKTDQMVAIKLIRNKKRFHHQALVEVKILDALRRKDKDNQYNIIHMGEYFYFRNHLCITFELMGMNLYELIKKNNFQGFSIALIRRFAVSLLQCLKLLQREKIIHCDLKPENILLRQRGQSSIKVIDFGSSCYEHQRGYPLFPGENEVEQLACIMEVIGLPPNPVLEQATRRRLFFDSKGNPRCITNSKGKKRRVLSKDLQQCVKTSDANFLDFIRRCLDWDPITRLTPEDALEHEWIKEGLVSRKKDQKHGSAKKNSANSGNQLDPYKVPAQPPVKEKSKTDEWKLTLKGRKSAKKEERVPLVGASAEHSHDEINTYRAPMEKSTKGVKKVIDANIIEEITKLNMQGQLSHPQYKHENALDTGSLPPIAK